MQKVQDSRIFSPDKSQKEEAHRSVVSGSWEKSKKNFATPKRIMMIEDCYERFSISFF